MIFESCPLFFYELQGALANACGIRRSKKAAPRAEAIPLRPRVNIV